MHNSFQHFCMRCLHCFSSKNLLKRHQGDCFALNGTQAIDMPGKGEKIFSTNNHRMLSVPFVIYADFEVITEKIPSCQPPPKFKKSFTTTYQSHRACSYGYKVVYHSGRKYKNGDKDKPVRDHCHITGKYRGSAHGICNLKLGFDSKSIKIPVIFRNLQGYDCHFIISPCKKSVK